MPRLLLAAPFLLVLHAAAQAPEDSRPPLFFREDWKEIAAVAPVTQEHVANPALLLGLYGPGKDGVRKSHHDTPKDDPYYIWLGSCPSSCAIALRSKDAFVDLTGLAKVRWRTKQTGFRSLRLTLKLANGMWLVSDYAEGPTVDWHESEFAIAGIRWRRMNIETIVEGAWVEKPDLSKVDEIGWTELAPGGNTPASSRVDWIEVYGKPVKRSMSRRLFLSRHRARSRPWPRRRHYGLSSAARTRTCCDSAPGAGFPASRSRAKRTTAATISSGRRAGFAMGRRRRAATAGQT